MVVRGGQNVYCIEVENKLYLHPKVLRAAVVGVPDHVFSERLKAVVVLKPGQSATAEEMRDHCAAHLASTRRRNTWSSPATLPTNPAGKTLKPPLVDFWGEALGDAAARFAAFCASQPESLLDRPQLRLDGEALTPRQALAALRSGDALGQRLAAAIDAGGIVALTRPDEARFRT